ncbi:hypothetical protein J6590_061805 [Homalodisca vitripennis]|nr:hypothetical protein J6590_061805 [Homalodisca vitripennis]
MIQIWASLETDQVDMAFIDYTAELVAEREIKKIQSNNGALPDCSPSTFQISSTIDAVTSLIDSVVDSLERREHLISIFLDLSKAFDCVHHEILGVAPVMVKRCSWFASQMALVIPK